METFDYLFPPKRRNENITESRRLLRLISFSLFQVLTASSTLEIGSVKNLSRKWTFLFRWGRGLTAVDGRADSFHSNVLKLELFRKARYIFILLLFKYVTSSEKGLIAFNYKTIYIPRHRQRFWRMTRLKLPNLIV